MVVIKVCGGDSVCLFLDRGRGWPSMVLMGVGRWVPIGVGAYRGFDGVTMGCNNEQSYVFFFYLFSKRI